MKKREFLQKLREYLSYELPQQYVEKNISFYSRYIDDEVAGGKSMDEVLDSLGDPQLIARSIVDAAKSGSDGIPNTADDVDFSGEIYGDGGPGASSGDYGGQDSSPYGGGYADDRGGQAGPHMSWQVYNGGGCFLFIVIMLVLMCFISVFGWMLNFLSPVLMPICVVLLIMWLMSRRE